jgi:hypothetical protein
MRQDKLHGLGSICFTRSRSLHSDPAVTKGTSTTRSHAKKQLKTPKLNREQQRTTHQKHSKGTIMQRLNFFLLTSDFPATSLKPQDHSLQYAFGRLDSSVETMTKLPAGRPTNRGSTPRKGQMCSLSTNVHIAAGVCVAYSTSAADYFNRDRADGA